MKQKFHIILICLVILSVPLSNAVSQEMHKGKFNLGFEGGVQFNNVEDRTTLNPASSKAGYAFGPYIEYFMSDIFSVKLGLHIDNRGFKIDDLYVGLISYSEIIPDSVIYSNNTFFHKTRDYNINYLTIPLSIRYVKGSEKFKIYVEAGVFYSLLLNATQEGQNHIYTDPQYAPHFKEPFNVPGHQFEDFNGDTTSLFNTYDFGINLFLGGIVQFNPQWALTIAPGFSYSFANLYYQPEIDAKWTQIFRINAGVLYTFKKK